MISHHLQAIAWTTAAHRFTRNPYEDSPIRPSSEVEGQIQTDEKEEVKQEALTEVNVNLNEPKPEPVYLRR